MDAILSRLRFRLTWTQWFIGVWWWPVPKDLAFGVFLGPFSITWTRERDT